jgi:hypothetical protein
MGSFTSSQLSFFKSLFRGREDVFAIRWEKAEKSGYTPAYDFNWEDFSKHRASGGTLKDFSNKQLSKLTEQRIINHLSGKEIIGLYPLLTDNSSWFIIADFDESLTGKKSWVEECRIFVNACQQLKIPAYLERSRSGNGGHVWIFFSSNFPLEASEATNTPLFSLVCCITGKSLSYKGIYWRPGRGPAAIQVNGLSEAHQKYMHKI